MSDKDDDDLFDSDSDDTAELLAAASAAKKKKQAPAKNDKDLFDSDSEDEDEDDDKKGLTKREKIQALAQKKAAAKAPAKKKSAKAAPDKPGGYESEDSADSGNFERTKEDDDFIDTTGEDADAVRELYEEQHFGSQPQTDSGKKKRKYRDDEALEDKGEPDNPIMAAVQRMQKKKRTKKMQSELEDEIRLVMARMEAAANEDDHLISQKQPATRKLVMLSEVVHLMTRKDIQRLMIDLDFLKLVQRWLQPLPSGKLGNVTIRSRLVDALEPWDISAGDLKRSELGKIVMVLYKHPNETPALKRKLKQLIEQWSRPVFQKSNNMRDLKHVHHHRGATGISALSLQQRQAAAASAAAHVPAQQSMDSLIASGKKGSTDSGVNRVRVPFSKGFSYSVRPESKTVGAVAVKLDDGGRSKLAKRMVEKSRVKPKNQRSANISIEGRATKG